MEGGKKNVRQLKDGHCGATTSCGMAYSVAHDTHFPSFEFSFEFEPLRSS
jgi:hypothetical protein